ncbi:putative glycerol kinase 5 [Drosophila guanche]|uniref:Glycerol kinase 5 n=1 Tax=Drosophila guanche TaxID=7266 RepID=A0A3B0JUT6_DROGU|nr:putative glycerol kinase 5 [Drosophila guanche]SPP77126.1 blast:Putative glycerol kinase 5 [Drosophila guanche]
MSTASSTTADDAPAPPAYIAALDVGTTCVRCFVLDDKCLVKGQAVDAVELLNPQPGFFEIEPESLWRKIVNVITLAIRDAKLKPTQITCLTISTQRCTFLTWNHKTGEYYHNFITWKDLRADALVDQWNSSWTKRSMNGVSYALYLVTRNHRFLAGSVLKLMNGQVTPRLLFEMAHNQCLKQALRENKARVELLDSWILHKLRSGNGKDTSVEHITDITSSTATGLYDPFTLSWSPLISWLFGFDTKILPRVVDNGYKGFGHVHPAAFGSDWEDTCIPIAASLSDQAASMWGSQCFSKNDVKVTMGTGAFLNLITGSECRAAISGMYPLVAWQIKNKSKNQGAVYCIEGASHDFGTVVTWAQSCELFKKPDETSLIAESVPDTNDVFFMPAFSGLGPPVNDYRSASGFIGLTPSTTKAHMVRALLESIVFRLVQLIDATEKETSQKLKMIRVNGGVSRNDFVCQFLADLSRLKVERAENTESSIMGATFMAGINHGIWKDVEDLKCFRKVERVFEPRPKVHEKVVERMDKWCRAIDRFSDWY